MSYREKICKWLCGMKIWNRLHVQTPIWSACMEWMLKDTTELELCYLKFLYHSFLKFVLFKLKNFLDNRDQNYTTWYGIAVLQTCWILLNAVFFTTDHRFLIAICERCVRQRRISHCNHTEFHLGKLKDFVCAWEYVISVKSVQNTQYISGSSRTIG